MQVQIDICVLQHSMGCCPLDQCCQDARQQHIQLDERWLTYYPRHCKSALGEQFTCVVWDREALKGREWDRTASPSTISVSMMVSWKYASRETASTCAEASARVCHSTTLSQNQYLGLLNTGLCLVRTRVTTTLLNLSRCVLLGTLIGMCKTQSTKNIKQ